jgi:ubiquinone/menaquinone biosynthesis C-methylase UbiE
MEIIDCIGSEIDDYIENCEEIAKTFKKGPSLETQAICNCCEVAIQNLNDVDSIIDVGCGFGYVIQKLSVAKRVALDISLTHLRRIDPKIIRIRANAENIPCDSFSFDVAICTDCFEHVQNEYKLASELNRILKPGGYLLLAFPWKQDLSVYELKKYKEKYGVYKYVHLRSLDERTIPTYFGNFEVIASTEITVAISSMEFKPYAIEFYQLKKY